MEITCNEDPLFDKRLDSGQTYQLSSWLGLDRLRSHHGWRALNLFDKETKLLANFNSPR